MRPATAASRKSQMSARSIWKKYESIKPQKNQFYCFKTISEILDSHLSKNFKDNKKEIYYHKINSPRKQLKQNNSFKDNVPKKMTTVIDRNPTIKKTMTNNFFSNKQIGKENNNFNTMTHFKTQNKIQTQTKFLPYRQQSFSIIKSSKILNDMENAQKQEEWDHKKSQNSIKNDPKTSQRKSRMKQKDKPHNPNELAALMKKISSDENQKNNQFIIQQWKNFEQDEGNFSMLISNANKIH